MSLFFFSAYVFSLKGRIPSFSSVSKLRNVAEACCLLLVCTILIAAPMDSSTLEYDLTGPGALPCQWSHLAMSCLTNWKRDCHLQPQELFAPVCECATAQSTLSSRPPSCSGSCPDCPWLRLTVLIGVALNAVLLWIVLKIGTKIRLCTSKRAEKGKGKKHVKTQQDWFSELQSVVS